MTKITIDYTGRPQSAKSYIIPYAVARAIETLIGGYNEKDYERLESQERIIQDILEWECTNPNQ
jgi:hypothetical protein